MEVIVCHTNADFDALGCLTAAKVLRPKAVACFPGHINKKVRELYSLYKDSVNLTPLEHINVQEVKHLIVVDTQNSQRIGKFKEVFLNPRVKLTIIDHHTRLESLPEWAEVVVHEVGAATTLLVEEIMERGIAISSSIATILATAIYSDTGCLTANYTTSREAKAVAFLLDQGASLEVVSNYTRSPLSDGQRTLFEDLMAASQEIVVNEAKIRITTCDIGEYVDGLAQLTSRLAEIDDCDACVAIVNMDDRIHIVGRSKQDRIDMKKLMQPFGGNGHRQAASATVKGESMENVIAQVQQALPSIIEPPLRASDIMSHPVRSVDPDTTMSDAGRIMLRSGHSGLPVVQDSKLLGIISRRDLDKANHHGLQNAPVKGFMSTAVVGVSSNASVDEIQRLLIQKDIGRLPVIDQDGALVGIVTRTDVLRTLHGKSYPHWYQVTYRAEPAPESITEENITELLESHLGSKRLGILLLIAQEAERQGSRAYLVGGMVRDILMGHNNVDIDIVIEPEAAPVARGVAKLLHAQCVEYSKFGTATLSLPSGEHIDFVTARTEFYAMPAAMPEVENATIKKDLYRRDFTINTLAVVLNPSSFGNLLDFFGAREDLKQGLVRVLYNLSFVEDPTRIIRAVRFEQRYGFKLEEQTERFLRNALENGVLEKVSREKLRDELRLLLSEEAAAKSILRMDELGVWQHFLPDFVLSDRQINFLRDVSQQDLEGLDSFSLYVIVLMLYKPFLEWPELIETLRLPKKSKEIALEFMEHAEDIMRGMHDDSTTSSDLWITLEPLHPETRFLIAALVGEDGLTKLTDLLTLGSVKPALSGTDLIANGVHPGPVMGRILRQLKKARLDGTISTREEELHFLNTLMAQGLKGGV
ncbi:MAG: CBS domain-containing protein [Bacillota bacterium]|nr:CBS domain-containing protein [Bacillota bacterium]